MKNNRRIRPGNRKPQAAKAIRVGNKISRDILGIAMLTVTVIIILSLMAFLAERKWVGALGEYLAGKLAEYLGWSALLVPLITFFLAIILFIPSREKRWSRAVRMSGLALIIMALASFPSTLNMRDPVFGTRVPGGGALGMVAADLLMGVLGRGGSLVILAAFFLVGLLMATGLSLRQIGSLAGRGWIRIDRTFGDWLRGLFRSEVHPRSAPKHPARPEEKKPEIVEKPVEIKISQPPVPKQITFNFRSGGDFELPPLSLLSSPPPGEKKISHDTLLMNSKILEKKLRDFGIEGQVTHVHPGPVITMYEYAPAAGVKVNRITNLQDDLAMAMSAYSVRVVAPIPGKSVVGIEIPNSESETVYLLDILSSDEYKKNRSKLAFALGKDIFGHPVSTDLARMPHLLIAGATGSGKSVMLNTLICSILFRATPDQVKFLLIDPKMVELMPYEGIPHLITPVVTNPKKASWALRNIVSIMEGRYKILAEKDAKNIESYNHLVKEGGKKAAESDLMPYLVIVIDELADLMMLASGDVEDSVTRLAQMARAVGIHLVLATQRPSVNVITGVIKANLPTRISFQVSSKNDSRIILDANGAEQLLGKGDMLFLPPGASKLRRIHGAFISEGEIRQVVDFIKKQAEPTYDETILSPVETDDDDEDLPEGELDEKYQEAVELVRRTGQASISMIQRRLRVGYNRAARMVEQMEKEGIISAPDGIKPRRIL